MNNTQINEFWEKIKTDKKSKSKKKISEREITIDGEQVDLSHFSDEERAEAFIQFLIDQGNINSEYDVNDVKESTYNDDVFEYGNAEYLVVTYDEAEDAFYEELSNFYDEFGISGYTDWVQSHILNNFIDEDYIDSYIRETIEYVVNDLNDYELEEYYNQYNIDYDEENIEDSREDLIEEMINEINDPIQYIKDNFGEDEFMRIADNNINKNEVIDYIASVEDMAQVLNRYDGSEDSVQVDGTTYYIYRQN